MERINELDIWNYRGLQNLTLRNIGDINLLVGRNNAGKTSILEAIELLSAPGDMYQMIQTARGRDRTATLNSRSFMLLESVLWTFPVVFNQSFEEQERSSIKMRARDTKNEIVCNFSCEDTTTLVELSDSLRLSMPIPDIVGDFVSVRALNLTFEVNKNEEYYSLTETFTGDLREYRRHDPKKKIFDTKMITPVDHRLVPVSPRALTNSIVSGNKEQLIELLQDFDKDIEDIEILSPDDQSAIPYFRHKYKGYLPISIYGDGIRRVLTIATAILQAQGGILLIDELETAIHAKSLKTFFEWLVESCKRFNVQLFATTHSLEAIDAIVAAESELLEGLKVFRLSRDEVTGDTTSTGITGEMLYTLRVELGQDVRG